MSSIEAHFDRVASILRPGILILVARAIRAVFALPVIASLYLMAWVMLFDSPNGEGVGIAAFLIGTAILAWTTGSVALAIHGHKRDLWTPWSALGVLMPVAHVIAFPFMAALVWVALEAGVRP